MTFWRKELEGVDGQAYDQGYLVGPQARKTAIGN
jgi:hypothetical protein